ncbi:hypothetical protein DFH09DRAFT_1290807 [Mycena vulgaris]|nr:hypothetical protein DFH09DRAFT_1290807 [Mycena vulgaris]
MAHLHCCARLAYARSAPDETRRHASKVVVNNHPAREMTRLRRVGTRREKQKQKAQRFGRREGKGMCTARSESPSFSSELRSVDLARTPTPVRRIAFRGASSPCPDSSSPRSPPPSLFTSASARSSAQFSVYPPALIPLLPRPVTHIHTRPPQTTPTAMTPAARAPRHPSHRMPSSTHSPHCSSLLPPGRAPLPAFAPPAPSSASSCAPPTRAANRLRRRTRFPGSVKPRVASSSCSRPARAPLLLASLLVRSGSSTRRARPLAPAHALRHLLQLRRARTDSQYTPPSPPRVSTPAHLHARQPHDVPPSRSTRPSSRAMHAARTRHGPRKLPMTILVIAKKASPARTHHTSPPPPFPPQQAQLCRNRQLADLKKKAARVLYTSGDSPPSPSSLDAHAPRQESSATSSFSAKARARIHLGLRPAPADAAFALGASSLSLSRGDRFAQEQKRPLGVPLITCRPIPQPARAALPQRRVCAAYPQTTWSARGANLACLGATRARTSGSRCLYDPDDRDPDASGERTRVVSKAGGTGDDDCSRWWREGWGCCAARGACCSTRWVRGGPAGWRWGAGLGPGWGALARSQRWRSPEATLESKRRRGADDALRAIALGRIALSLPSIWAGKWGGHMQQDDGFGWIREGGVEEARLSARRRQGLQAEGEVGRDIHGKESSGAPTSASDLGWRRSLWMRCVSNPKAGRQPKPNKKEISVARRRNVSHITRMGTNVGRLRLRLRLSAIREEKVGGGRTSPQASGLRTQQRRYSNESASSRVAARVTSSDSQESFRKKLLASLASRMTSPPHPRQWGLTELSLGAQCEFLHHSTSGTEAFTLVVQLGAGKKTARGRHCATPRAAQALAHHAPYTRSHAQNDTNSNQAPPLSVFSEPMQPELRAPPIQQPFGAAALPTYSADPGRLPVYHPYGLSASSDSWYTAQRSEGNHGESAADSKAVVNAFASGLDFGAGGMASAGLDGIGMSADPLGIWTPMGFDASLGWTTGTWELLTGTNRAAPLGSHPSFE